MSVVLLQSRIRAFYAGTYIGTSSRSNTTGSIQDVNRKP